MVPGPPPSCMMPKRRHAQIPYVKGRMVPVGRVLALLLNQNSTLRIHNAQKCTHTHTHTIKMVKSLHIIYIHPPTYFKPSLHDSYNLVQCQCYGNSSTVLLRGNRQEKRLYVFGTAIFNPQLLGVCGYRGTQSA